LAIVLKHVISNCYEDGDLPEVLSLVRKKKEFEREGSDRKAEL